MVGWPWKLEKAVVCASRCPPGGELKLWNYWGGSRSDLRSFSLFILNGYCLLLFSLSYQIRRDEICTKIQRWVTAGVNPHTVRYNIRRDKATSLSCQSSLFSKSSIWALAVFILPESCLWILSLNRPPNHPPTTPQPPCWTIPLYHSAEPPHWTHPATESLLQGKQCEIYDRCSSEFIRKDLKSARASSWKIRAIKVTTFLLLFLFFAWVPGSKRPADVVQY